MRKLLFGFTLLLATVVAGCGGGDSGSAPLSAKSVSGVAAAGSPLQGKVYLKDSGFRNLSTAIGDDGSFSFNIIGLKKPFLLKADGSANGRSWILYSVSREGGTANVNPLSQVVTADAAGGDPGSVFDASDRSSYQSIADGVARSLSETRAALGGLLQAFDAARVNPITDPYLANHTGLDRLFDVASIETGAGRLTVTNNLDGSTILAVPITGMTTASLAAENIPQLSGSAPRKWHLRKSVETTTDASFNVLSTTLSFYSYDGSGHLLAVAVSSGAPGAPSTATTHYSGFDSYGNPATTTSTEQRGTAAYEYDANGRITKKSGVAAFQFPTGRLYYTMTYSSTYAYNPDGSYRVKTSATKIYGTGLEVPVSEIHDYDAKGNLLSYTYNGERVLDYSYTYDLNGNAATATFTNGGSGEKGNAAYEWEYF